jgi:hypothetical protein
MKKKIPKSLKGKYIYKDLDWEEQNEILSKFSKTLKKLLKFSEDGRGTSLDSGEREYHLSRKLKNKFYMSLNITVSIVEVYITDYHNFFKKIEELDFIDPDLLNKINNIYYAAKQMM